MNFLRITLFSFLLIVVMTPIIVQAACPPGANQIQISVYIPGGLTKSVDGAKPPCYYIEGGLPQYIAGIYNFGLMVAGFLAMVMIMIGGFMYIAAGGNQTIIGKAKERIFNALIGLVILLLSYTILNTINPDLVNQARSKATLGEKVPPTPEEDVSK